MESEHASPELVLSAQAVLQDAAGIAGAEPGDMVLDRPDQRQHSKLVNATTARLLEQFRAPKRLPEAVAALSRAQGLDPFEVLSEAAPLIAELRTCGILQPVTADQPARTRFAPGANLYGYRIEKILRRTGDTEVALALTDAGRCVALKTSGPDAHPASRDAFGQEIGIAKSLSGSVSPRVLDVIKGDAGPVLVTEWIEGLPLDRYVASGALSGTEMLALCRRVVTAFSKVHAAGVLHGDIRPSNILVDGQGRVWLIDFGLSQARRPGARRLSYEVQYLEPEAAVALRRGRLPDLTVQGEVCALALVLAEMILGKAVRSLPALRDAALDRIVGERVRIRTGMVELDHALERAIAPLQERFGDMASFENALGRVTIKPDHPPRTPAPHALPSLDQAVLMMRAAELSSDPDFLAAAEMSFRMDAARNASKPQEVSPLYAPMARHLLRARLAYAARRFDVARRAVDMVNALAGAPRTSPELFDGSAGDLLHLTRFVQDYRLIDDHVSGLTGLISDLCAHQTRQLGGALKHLVAGRPTHLGMAHGLCGQLFAILNASQALGTDPDKRVLAGLDHLAGLSHPVGKGLAWPGTMNPKTGHPRTADFAPGWCNGTAGFLLLWMTASDVYGATRFAQLAEASACYTLGHTDATANLCCGRAGRAIALSIYGAWTGSEVWREKARQIAQEIHMPRDHHSVFRGLAGAQLAILETSAVAPRFPV